MSIDEDLQKLSLDEDPGLNTSAFFTAYDPDCDACNAPVLDERCLNIRDSLYWSALAKTRRLEEHGHTHTSNYDAGSLSHPSTPDGSSESNTEECLQRNISLPDASPPSPDPKHLHAASTLIFKRAPLDWVGISHLDLEKTAILFEDDTVYFLIYQTISKDGKSTIAVPTPTGEIDHIRTASTPKTDGDAGEFLLWDWQDYQARRMQDNLGRWAGDEEAGVPRPSFYSLGVVDWMREEIQAGIGEFTSWGEFEDAVVEGGWEEGHDILRYRFYQAVARVIEESFWSQRG